MHTFFVRSETCYQIALAIKKEVEDLEAAGVQVNLSPVLTSFFILSIRPGKSLKCIQSHLDVASYI